MADNLGYTPGAGATIGADDISSIHFQRIKLIHGADGTNDGDVSFANPLPVIEKNPVRILTLDVTRPANTTAYAINDAIADTTPTAGGFTWSAAARTSGGTGAIQAFRFASANDAATPLVGEVFVFNQAVTAIADNAAFVISDTEVKTLICKLPFSLEDIGNNDFYEVNGLWIPYTCVGTDDLRFLMRAKNAYTPISGEVLTAEVSVQWLD